MIVITRNDRRLVTTTRAWVRNGDRWHIQDQGRDGSLQLASLDGRGTVTLPGVYVQQHVALAYAVTVHKGQGLTVDQGVLVVDRATGAEHLYVGMTRGRHRNLACVITEAAGDEHQHRQPPTPSEVLAAALRRLGSEKSATETLRGKPRPPGGSTASTACSHRRRPPTIPTAQLPPDPPPTGPTPDSRPPGRQPRSPRQHRRPRPVKPSIRHSGVTLEAGQSTERRAPSRSGRPYGDGERHFRVQHRAPRITEHSGYAPLRYRRAERGRWPRPVPTPRLGPLRGRTPETFGVQFMLPRSWSDAQTPSRLLDLSPCRRCAKSRTSADLTSRRGRGLCSPMS